MDQLVEDALRLFDDPSQPVASHARRAIRIAHKRQDYPALLRLLLETMDFTPETKVDHPAYLDAQANLAALIGKENADRQSILIVMRYQRDRALLGDPKMIHGQSVGQIEASLRQIVEVMDHYSHVPSNLTPADTYLVAKDYDRAAAKVMPKRADLEAVLERIRQSVHDLLVDTEQQLESGQRRPTIFERGQAYIENSLAQRAPDAIGLFQAAEEALVRGRPEDFTHALASCRRMIKALADALYPATGEIITGTDGKERRMTDDAYRNRLMQFAVENIGGSTHREFVQEALRGLGSRLNRLEELSSKGVHDTVGYVEAETCVMWTYLTAADFLRIADGSSPRLTESAAG